MPKFRIPVMWEMAGSIEVEADSKESLADIKLAESELPQSAHVNAINIATESAEEIG